MTAQVMASSSVQRWGGAAFVLGNLLFLVNKLNEMSRLFLGRWMPDVISGQDILLVMLGQVALISGFVIYFQWYAPHVRRLGSHALRLFCGGGIVLAVGHVSFMPISPSELVFILVLIGGTLMLIGLLLFGVANLRQPITGRWPWLPLTTGLMGFIGFFLFSGEEITAVFLAFRTLFALGLVGLGVILWLEKPIIALNRNNSG